MYINLNSQILPACNSHISTNNRSFKFGDALFESIRIINTKLPFLSFHYDRLIKGMNILEMDIPTFLTEEFMLKEINLLISKNNIKKHGRIRFTVFRNEGLLYTPENNSISFLIEVMPLPDKNQMIDITGINTCLFKDIKKPINKLSNIKSANALLFVLAGVYCKNNEFDDSFILNENDNIIEGISSNIFTINKKKITSPPISDGCVEGVMRKVIINIIKDNNISFQEKSIKYQDLKDADEIFFTNAIQGIQWVRSFEGENLLNLNTLIIYQHLRKLIGLNRF